MHNQLVQFTLVRKGYDNHHCHNKPPDRKWGLSVGDVISGRDVPENLRIFKKLVQIGQWRHRVEFLPLRRELDLGR